MTENSRTLDKRNNILLSFSEIFIGIKRIDDVFIAIKRSDARYTGILAGGLVLIFWGALGVPLLLNYLFPMPTGGTYIPPESYYTFSRVVVISIPILCLIVGFVAYYFAKKSYVNPFVVHKNKVEELEKAIRENRTEEINVIEKILTLMDQMSSWMPKLKTYKSVEAESYGFAAFFLFAFISFLSGTLSVGLPISLLIGVIVWLYFRFEKRKEADERVQEFKSWKEKFEEEKESFLETI
jgi:protein-S-isoprenylcysteine O-methyltransferase Ste14